MQPVSLWTHKNIFLSILLTAAIQIQIWCIMNWNNWNIALNDRNERIWAYFNENGIIQVAELLKRLLKGTKHQNIYMKTYLLAKIIRRFDLTSPLKLYILYSLIGITGVIIIDHESNKYVQGETSCAINVNRTLWWLKMRLKISKYTTWYD